jgi:hypothetical protein
MRELHDDPFVGPQIEASGAHRAVAIEMGRQQNTTIAACLQAGGLCVQVQGDQKLAALVPAQIARSEPAASSGS